MDAWNRRIASSRVNDLIINQKDVSTIEREILIIIDDISLNRNHFLGKARSSVHKNFV